MRSFPVNVPPGTPIHGQEWVVYRNSHCPCPDGEYEPCDSWSGERILLAPVYRSCMGDDYLLYGYPRIKQGIKISGKRGRNGKLRAYRWYSWLELGKFRSYADSVLGDEPTPASRWEGSCTSVQQATAKANKVPGLQRQMGKLLALAYSKGNHSCVHSISRLGHEVSVVQPVMTVFDFYCDQEEWPHSSNLLLVEKGSWRQEGGLSSTIHQWTGGGYCTSPIGLVCTSWGLGHDNIQEMAQRIEDLDKRASDLERQPELHGNDAGSGTPSGDPG